MSYAQQTAGGYNATSTEPRPTPMILATVTGALNDARAINKRLNIILNGLRVSPPQAVKESQPEPMPTLSTAAEMVSKAQAETFELLSEIERFV